MPLVSRFGFSMKVTQVLLIEGSVNVLITLVKVGVGMQTGSSAILADAFHSATDVANNGVAWMTHRIASKPPDSSHPYGHRKFEYLAVFVLAVLLCVIAVELMSYIVSNNSHVPVQSSFSLWIMLGAALGSLAVSGFEFYWARRLDSKLLDADARHSVADAGTTIVAVSGWQLSLWGYPWLDPVFAMVVVGIVVYLAVSLFRQVIPVLVDAAVVDEKQVIQVATQVPGVIRIERVRSRSTGTGTILEIKAIVAADLTTVASHQIADQLEADLAARFNLTDVIVHIEPV